MVPHFSSALKKVRLNGFASLHHEQSFSCFKACLLLADILFPFWALALKRHLTSATSGALAIYELSI